MSVTTTSQVTINVRTPTNAGDEDDSWAATHWRVEEGHLWVCNVDTLIAEYPPGQWTAVWREEEAKEDGGPICPHCGQVMVTDDGQTFGCPDASAPKLWIMGVQYGVTGIDYHQTDGTATLHAAPTADRKPLA